MPEVAPCYRYRATLGRVIDGDTYVLVIDLGFFVAVALHVRLRAVNAPELHAAGGAAARDYANGVLTAAKEIVVESYKDERSFERWICDVYVDGEDLGDVLVAAGMAVPE